MIDPQHLELVHAEIDGELDAERRAELARLLLANPQLRAVRDEMKRLCAALDALVQVDPPVQLSSGIFAALPRNATQSRQSWWLNPSWRYAALVAGVLVGGIVVFETVEGPSPSKTDVAGTVARRSIPVDSARLEGGPVSGRISLYRDAAGFSLALELTAGAPVEVRVTSGDQVLGVSAVAPQKASGAQLTVVALPRLRAGGETVDVSLVMAGRQVSRTTLRVPQGP